MSKDDLKLIVVSYYEAFREYGHYLPVEISERLNSELMTIINNHESGEWYMLWWVWTHYENPENLTFTQGMDTSFLAYLFGISDYNPMPEGLDLHFKKTSLFNVKRAFKLYCILQGIREMSSSKELIDDDSLFYLSMALSPFSIKNSYRTIGSVFEDLMLDRMLDGKLDER